MPNSPKPHNFFQDSNGDYSSSRLNQFLIVVGSIGLSAMAIDHGQADAAGLIFGAGAAAAGAVGWKTRDAEAKENIVDKAQPVDGSVEIKA